MDASRQEDSFEQCWERLGRLSRWLERLTPDGWTQSGRAAAVEDLTWLVACCHSISETSGATLATALLSAVEVASARADDSVPGHECVDTWSRAVTALRRSLETFEATGECEDRSEPELLSTLCAPPQTQPDTAATAIEYEEEIVEQPVEQSIPAEVRIDYPTSYPASTPPDAAADQSKASAEESAPVTPPVEEAVEDTVADVEIIATDEESVSVPFPVVPEDDAEPGTASVESSADEPDVEAADVEAADVETADVETADVETADVETADVETAEEETAAVSADDPADDSAASAPDANAEHGESVEDFILPITRDEPAPAPSLITPGSPAVATTSPARIPTSAMLLVNLADDSQRALPLCDVLRVARVPWSTIVEEQHGRSAWISGVRIPVVELAPDISCRHHTDPQSVVVAIREQRRVGLCVATVGPILEDTAYEPVPTVAANLQQTIDVDGADVQIVTAAHLLRLADGEPLPGTSAPPRVLLIHPSGFHLRVIAMSLRSAEFVVKTASDLNAAVEKFAQDGPFHVVAADLAIAAPDGFRFGSWLREQTSEPVVTVAISDLAGSGAAAIARHAGFDWCLRAGEVDELVELIHNTCIDTEGPRAASA